MSNEYTNDHIHINYDLYANDLSMISSEASSNKVTAKAHPLQNCKGPAIEKINNCMKAYNDFALNLNSLYEATANYVEAVYNNTQAADKGNIIN